jgi:hypothetical protein
MIIFLNNYLKEINIQFWEKIYKNEKKKKKNLKLIIYRKLFRLIMYLFLFRKDLSIIKKYFIKYKYNYIGKSFIYFY